MSALERDEMGWPIAIRHGMRVCAAAGKCRYGLLTLDTWKPSEEFRIDGYCSCECRDEAELHEEIASLRADLATLKAENAKLHDDIHGLDEAIAALEERDKWANCACMCDRVDDVCLVHSPAVARARAERDEALALLEQIRTQTNARVLNFDVFRCAGRLANVYQLADAFLSAHPAPSAESEAT